MSRRTGTLFGLALLALALGCTDHPGEGPAGPTGWTVVLGGGITDTGYPQHPHCLYQVTLAGGPATELYCPDEARWIDWALPPRRGADEMLFVAEVDAHSGIYGAEFPIYEPWVQELYRLTIPDGERTLLGYWLADSFDGSEPVGALHHAIALGDGVVAAHWTIPTEHGGRGEELVLIEADGSVGDDLRGDLQEVRLLDAGDDGLVVRHADGDGRLQLRAISPYEPQDIVDFQLPPDGPLSADVEDHHLLLDAQADCVLLEIGDVPTQACTTGTRALGTTFDGHVMGFAGDGWMGAGEGGVLLEQDDVVWYWDGLDGSQPESLGTPTGVDGVGWDAQMHPAGDQGAIFRGYQSSNERDHLFWYHDGAMTGCGTTLASVSGASFALGTTEEPVALMFDSDWESPTRNQVFACLPDGTTDEITNTAGLRGVLLPSGQIW